MNWRALSILILALSVYAPFVGDVSAKMDSPCCMMMQSCSGHCNCHPNQTCAVAKPAPVDQQILARTTALAQRVEIQLFTLATADVAVRQLDRNALAPLFPATFLDTSQKLQARLCHWLI